MVIGIGTDIVRIDKVKTEDKFITRWMSAAELDLLKDITDIKKSEFIAGRWAAKEAIYKALDNKIDDYKLIEVLKTEEGAPVCKIKDYIVHVSISHNDEFATAFAVIEK